MQAAEYAHYMRTIASRIHKANCRRVIRHESRHVGSVLWKTEAHASSVAATSHWHRLSDVALVWLSRHVSLRVHRNRPRTISDEWFNEGLLLLPKAHVAELAIAEIGYRITPDGSSLEPVEMRGAGLGNASSMAGDRGDRIFGGHQGDYMDRCAMGGTAIGQWVRYIPIGGPHLRRPPRLVLYLVLYRTIEGVGRVCSRRVYMSASAFA
eukprot:1196134-Prorocentrum_minimum.AAC.3